VVDEPVDSRAACLIERARTAGRDALLATEGFELLEALGIRVPVQRLVRDRREAGEVDLSAFSGERVVVKAASPALAHKTEVGAVVVVPAAAPAIRSAIDRMARRLAGFPVYGYTIAEFIPHAEGLSGELLVGLRNTDDFGPVVVLGPGGVHAELLARHLVPGSDLAVLARPLSVERMVELLGEKPATRIVGGLGRDGRASLPLDRLAALAERLLAFGESDAGRHVAELEINPLALTCDGPVALDVLVTLRRDAPPGWPPRPLHKLRHLLRPETIALVGVSKGTNPGRLILLNLLRAGFPANDITVIKPGLEQVGGVRCVPDLDALSAPVDLCVLSVAAARVPGLMDQIVRTQRAESVIVIPSGLGEGQGSAELERQMRDVLAAARETPWGGPVVNGGNCLGIRSAPGHYDATFIPEYKVRAVGHDGREGPPLPRGRGDRGEATDPRGDTSITPIALMAQSGAFAIARWSKLAGLEPRYLISVGNQTDLTLGDYLTYLKDDPDVRLFACYAEGFRPGDGRRWLEAAAAIVASGRSVLLYRGARTPAGVRAGVSHTAALAGDYVVTRELARAAGVLVADSLEEFDDALRLFALLGDRRAAGMRLGVMSNAGFECVVAADTLGPFQLAPLGRCTTARLGQALTGAGLGDVVPTGHPFDLSPMADDATLVACARILLEDEAVDAGVIGLVPLTGALETLPAGAGHTEDVAGPEAVAAGLARLCLESHKPWVAVVDAGHSYDELAARLEVARVPVFRSMDRALRAFATWCRVTEHHDRPLDPYEPVGPAAAGR
jgi:acyl-CoA synthetase (NDP forming)